MLACARQAIAALNRALAAEPTNAEVLLSLGVSYTNELDQGRALGFLTAWLGQQPRFRQVLPPLRAPRARCMQGPSGLCSSGTVGRWHPQRSFGERGLGRLCCLQKPLLLPAGLPLQAHARSLQSCNKKAPA